MIFFARTDRGLVRDTNEDSVFISGSPIGKLPDLFIVADGMGGYKAGDYASRRAIDLVLKSIRERKEDAPLRALRTAIDSANSTIFHEAQNEEDKENMGTTLVCAVISDTHLTVANVGDSRLYLLHDGALRQVTHDHSYVEELVRKGRMEEEEALHHPKKHYITRAIGAEETVEPDFFEEELVHGDKILMCTDGLTNMVSDEVLLGVLLQSAGPDTAAEKLVELANRSGGRDNITAIVIDI